MPNASGKWTVYLFRSGRVWVRLGEWRQPIQGVDQPLLTAHTEARTEIEALGKVLLQQVDRANQPHQHVCPPCDQSHYYVPGTVGLVRESPHVCASCPEPCCNLYCVCGLPSDAHTPSMDTPHMFTPQAQAPVEEWPHCPHCGYLLQECECIIT